MRDGERPIGGHTGVSGDCYKTGHGTITKLRLCAVRRVIEDRLPPEREFPY